MAMVETGQRSEAMKEISRLSGLLSRYEETPEEERRRLSTDSAM